MIPNRTTLGVLTVCAALGAGGCELVPGLLTGGGTPPPDPVNPGEAQLIVSVERAEGVIAGRPLEPQLVDATGFRTRGNLLFQLNVRSRNAAIILSTQGTDSSSDNPYGGGGGVPTDAGQPPALDAGPPPPLVRDAGQAFPVRDAGGAPNPSDPNAPSIVACVDNDCREADHFGLEIAQLVDGRSVVLDGAWSTGDHAHLELHYTEPR